MGVREMHPHRLIGSPNLNGDGELSVKNTGNCCPEMLYFHLKMH